jgi:hypothetical protein
MMLASASTMASGYQRCGIGPPRVVHGCNLLEFDRYTIPARRKSGVKAWFGDAEEMCLSGDKHGTLRGGDCGR